MLTYKSIDYWDEKLWQQVSSIYEEAFKDHSPKNMVIIRNMFANKLCFLHVVMEKTDNATKVVGMALTGLAPAVKAVIIDYIAIAKNERNKGIGSQLVNYLKKWTTTEIDNDGIIIEVEADISQENRKRIEFWEKCGFHLTSYVHKYIWVPEPYQAMYLTLNDKNYIPTIGEELFRHIGKFHRKCFQGQKAKKGEFYVSE